MQTFAVLSSGHDAVYVNEAIVKNISKCVLWHALLSTRGGVSMETHAT